MQKYNWNYPTTMWVGENRINDIGSACKTLNIKKPLLVTDKGLSKSDIVNNTLSILKSEGINREDGFNEILSSPVFKNFVISEDGKTSGIIVNIKKSIEPERFESEKEKQIFKDNKKKKIIKILLK